MKRLLISLCTARQFSQVSDPHVEDVLDGTSLGHCEPFTFWCADAVARVPPVARCFPFTYRNVVEVKGACRFFRQKYRTPSVCGP
jgi:hypothetical protein